MENKSESKNNLNESTMPLLDEADGAAKEKIELKEKTDAPEAETLDVKSVEAEAKKKAKEEEKERKRQQKEEEEQKKKAAKAEKEKKKAEEKELKKQQLEAKKAAKEAAKAANGGNSSPAANAGCPRQWNPVDQFSIGANLLVRDVKAVNEHVNVNFEDLMAEVDAAQGFDGVYRFSVGVFEFVRFWFYRLIMPILAIPFAIVWALIFGVLTLLSVWVLTPAFRVLDIVFYFLHRLWNGLVRTFLDPVFSSIALIRQNPVVAFNKTPLATSSGRPIYRETAGYSQVATSETVTFSKSAEGDEEVTLNIEQ